jgi:hypothetical protein
MEAEDMSRVLVRWAQRMGLLALPISLVLALPSVALAGTARLKIKLTRAGRTLLKHAKHLKLTAAGSFKPKQGKKVTKVQTLKLTG